MKKITYIISDIDKALAFEWITSYLDQTKFRLNFVLLNEGNSILEEFLKGKKIPFKRIKLKNRKSFFIAYIQLASFLWRNRPDVIHCHLRNAELIGIPVAFILRIKRRIFTRHNATYNHLFHPKGVWVDRLVNSLATDVVAVSENVRSILLDLENVKKKKVRLIPHGFDLELFKEERSNQVKELKKKYRLKEDYKIIGIIARYTWWKGYAYSIPAIGRLMSENSTLFLIIANAKGNDKDGIKKLIEEHIPKDRFNEILFENNLPALYKSFDYYVHVPFDATVEAFGQTYIESLASGVPSVFTLSGIAVDFIRHRKNALVVNYKSEEEIYSALKELIENPALGDELIKNGMNDVKDNFSIELMINKLQMLYASE